MDALDDAEAARMATTLPNDFISLDQVQSKNIGSVCNVIGIVADYLQPRKTAKNEWQATVRLVDQSFRGLGVQAVFFNEARDQVPEAKLGDVLVAEGVKINVFRGEKQLLSSKQSTDWVVIPLAGIVKPERRKSICRVGTLKCRRSAAADAPSIHKQQWAITLAHSRGQAGPPLQNGARHASKTGETPSDQHVVRAIDQKFSLIKDLRDQKFHNITGQMIKVVQAGSSVHGDIVDVHVTDYTSNAYLQDHGPSTGQDRYMERYAWSGPYGQYTIKVECHEPHGSWILNNVKPGQMVTLQNVRAKLSRDASFLEGNMFPDQRYPKKICAFKPLMDSQEVLDVLERRDSYQARAVKNGQTNLLRIRDEDGKEMPDKFSGQSNDSKKKKSKKAAKRSAEEELESESPRELLKRRTDPKLNASIRVTQLADSTRVCKMRDIVHNSKRMVNVDGTSHSLPFVNCRYMLQMQVVDFYPHDLKDFCVYTKVQQGGREESKWIWAFYLAVQAAHESADACKDHLLVEVSHKEASRFLGLGAADLRHEDNKELYGKLVRKLRLLWGDLDEVKPAYFASYKLDARSHRQLIYQDGIVVRGNRPFEGCVEEFGEPVSLTSGEEKPEGNQSVQWQRHYKLCETMLT